MLSGINSKRCSDEKSRSVYTNGTRNFVERMYKGGNLPVMQHFAFDDDRRRLLRPSVISDDAISVLEMPRSPSGVCPFRFLCDETSLEFNNFTAKRETFLSRKNRNNSFVFL